MLNKIRLKTPKIFLSRREGEELAKHVSHFERATGCELVFHFRKRLGPDPLNANRQLFHHYKLHKTKHRSAILITLALSERQFAVWADEGVIKKTGDALWKKVCESMSHKLKQGDRLGALVSAIKIAEEPLHQERPQELKDSENEIPDDPIIEGE